MDSPYHPPMPDFQKPKASGLAIASLICGLLGFVTLGLTGIAAVITGHKALSAIGKANGALTGRGMSITGLVTGYLTILLIPISVLAALALPAIMKTKMSAERAECVGNVRQIGIELHEFDEEYGTFPSNEIAEQRDEFKGLTGARVLDQLEATKAPMNISQFLAVSNRWKGDWLYFPGLSSKAAPEAPVLISPETDGKRIVLRVDCSATLVAAVDVASMDLSKAIAIPNPPMRK